MNIQSSLDAVLLELGLQTFNVIEMNVSDTLFTSGSSMCGGCGDIRPWDDRDLGPIKHLSVCRS